MMARAILLYFSLFEWYSTYRQQLFSNFKNWWSLPILLSLVSAIGNFRNTLIFYLQLSYSLIWRIWIICYFDSENCILILPFKKCGCFSKICQCLWFLEWNGWISQIILWNIWMGFNFFEISHKESYEKIIFGDILAIKNFSAQI